MTMHHALHPDHERLAAYAGGDADALADRALVEHLAACGQCRPLVEELTLLRGALAALPDLIPSRPLRLIPPIPAPAARRVGPLDWLRRLAAPAMAAGAGLVLIGAIGSIGTSGAARDLSATGLGGASLQESTASEGAFAPAARAASPTSTQSSTKDGLFLGRSTEPASQGSDSTMSPAPAVEGAGGRPSEALTTGTWPGQPWQALLLAGFALLGISAVLRYSLAPRAG